MNNMDKRIRENKKIAEQRFKNLKSMRPEIERRVKYFQSMRPGK